MGRRKRKTRSRQSNGAAKGQGPDAVPQAKARPAEWLIPNATVFLSSGCIMVVELYAGRLISRYVGQSLYTWTAIIGIILAGISIGNYVGGRLADRFRASRLLLVLFLAASASCLSLPVLNDWFGRAEFLIGLSWPARIFFHVALVFIVQSTLLGTISPVVGRFALSFGRATGRTVGNLYAWSIIGSIVGTFLAGYVFIAVLPVTTALWCMAGLLAGLGVVTSVVFRLPGHAAEVLTEPSETAADAVQRTGLSRRWLAILGAVFVANACVMIVELVASRFVAQHYGQSLYTWTTIIGVMLGGISLGSYFGGRLADRVDPVRLLVGLLLLGSAGTLCTTVLNRVVSDWVSYPGLPVAFRIFNHVVATFIVPSTALGAVTPVLAKTALEQGRPAGTTLGSVYACGSLGSILGTFLAGYFLIAAVGSVGTIWVVTGILIVLAVGYGRKRVSTYVAATACAALLAAACLPLPVAERVGDALGLRPVELPGTVYALDSQYSHVLIKKHPKRPSVRMMHLDTLLHSSVDLDNPRRLQYAYEYVYEAVTDKYYPDGAPISALVIGGGGYTYPHYLELTRPGSFIEAAEIDPAVTEAAYETFGFPRDSTVEVVHLDARNHVTDLIRKKQAGLAVPVYDCVFGDSINDFVVPYHLTTVEFVQNVYELLADDGMYLLNLIDVFEVGKFSGSVVNTCREVFPNVYVFNTSDDLNKRDTFVVVCAKKELDLSRVTGQMRATYDEYKGGLLEFGQLALLEERSRGLVLTDDFAPVENLLIEVVTRYRDTPDDLFVARGGDFLAERKNDEAIRNYLKALRYNPAHVAARTNLALCYYREKDYNAAIREWEKALEVAPEQTEILQNLGRVHDRLGNYRAAAAAYGKAGALDPEIPGVFSRQAKLLVRSGRLEEARDAWRKAVEAKPDDADLRYNLGLTMAQAGDEPGAIRVWKQAIEIDPKHGKAYGNLGVALRNTGDLAGATAMFEDAVQLEPEDPRGRMSLIMAYAEAKNYDQAWAQVEWCRVNEVPLDPNLVARLQLESGRER